MAVRRWRWPTLLLGLSHAGFLLLQRVTAQSESAGATATVTAVASDCTFNRSSWACKLNHSLGNHNSTLIELNSVQLTVKNDGRVISCSRGTRGERSRISWYGYCDGDAGDLNIVIVKGDDGMEQVFGSIHVGTDSCRITPSRTGGGTQVRCAPLALPISDDLSGYEPVILESDEDLHTGDRNLRFGFSGPSAERHGALIRGGASSAHSGLTVRRQIFDVPSSSTIDIMLVWTIAAECGLSGLPVTCAPSAATELTMRGAIHLVMAETNTAFVESGVHATLRLVHAYRDDSYMEHHLSSTSDSFLPAVPFAEDLDRLQRPSDGYLDVVHTKRGLYGADMVAMIAASESDCRGLGYLAHSSSHMFSITGHKCLREGAYTFVHEISHNLGCNHDRSTANRCNETGTYNYGYREPNGEFMTLMAYRERTSDSCDNVTSEIQHMALRLSNPNILYKGKPLGTVRENNARTINERRISVAAYFRAKNCQMDNECDDLDPATVDTCNLDNAACVYTPKALLVAPTTAPIGESPNKSPSPAVVPPAKAPVQVPTKDTCVHFCRLKRFWKRFVSR